jgi:hypothetical protein
MSLRCDRFSGRLHTLQVLNDGPDHCDHRISDDQKPLNKEILGEAIQIDPLGEHDSLLRLSDPCKIHVH